MCLDGLAAGLFHFRRGLPVGIEVAEGEAAAGRGQVTGPVHGVMQAVLRRESELPFGPSLCLATVLVVLLWEPLWSRLGVSFARPLEIVAVVVAVIVLTALSLAIWRRIRPS